MSNINRRKALAVVASVPAAVALGIGEVLANPDKDRLLDLIRRYNAEMPTVNTTRDLSDKELDAWIDRTDAILTEACGLPVLKGASAVAVIDLFIDEPKRAEHVLYGDDFLALVKNARNFIAAMVTARQRTHL
jgi:hypothetical protein